MVPADDSPTSSSLSVSRPVLPPFTVSLLCLISISQCFLLSLIPSFGLFISSGLLTVSHASLSHLLSRLTSSCFLSFLCSVLPYSASCRGPPPTTCEERVIKKDEFHWHKGRFCRWDWTFNISIFLKQCVCMYYFVLLITYMYCIILVLFT